MPKAPRIRLHRGKAVGATLIDPEGKSQGDHALVASHSRACGNEGWNEGHQNPKEFDDKEC